MINPLVVEISVKSKRKNMKTKPVRNEHILLFYVV